MMIKLIRVLKEPRKKLFHVLFILLLYAIFMQWAWFMQLNPFRLELEGYRRNKEKGILVGFFNVYIPQNELRAITIIAEQALALESVLSNIDHINTVIFGNHSVDVVQGVLNSKKYIFSDASATSGNEIVTLQLIFDHCEQHPQNKVFYIHSKGTYNPGFNNDVMRRNLMKAVAACIELNGLSEADACGLRFSPIPHPHFPGNMWLARCEYILKLPNPRYIVAHMSYLKRLAWHPIDSICTGAYIGEDRFASEHWIATHPSIIVADVLPSYTGLDPPYYTWNYLGLPPDFVWTPSLQIFPRKDLDPVWFFHPDKRSMACGLQSYRIFEYKFLFGKIALERISCDAFPVAWQRKVLSSGDTLWLDFSEFVVDMSKNILKCSKSQSIDWSW